MFFPQNYALVYLPSTLLHPPSPATRAPSRRISIHCLHFQTSVSLSEEGVKLKSQVSFWHLVSYLKQIVFSQFLWEKCGKERKVLLANPECCRLQSFTQEKRKQSLQVNRSQHSVKILSGGTC